MQKRILFLIVLLFATSIGLYAQNSNLKGVVQYEYNDYIGYKIDAGAEIYAISTKNATSVNDSIWQEYETLAKRNMEYLSVKNDDDINALSDETLRRFANFSHADKAKLDRLDKKCMEQFLVIKKNAENIELVDASGKYTMSLPYGEYYILAISKHRERPLLTELTGRKLLKKVKIDKPAIILSFDFCY
jgi:hypothetical protein